MTGFNTPANDVMYSLVVLYSEILGICLLILVGVSILLSYILDKFAVTQKKKKNALFHFIEKWLEEHEFTAVNLFDYVYGKFLYIENPIRWIDKLNNWIHSILKIYADVLEIKKNKSVSTAYYEHWKWKEYEKDRKHGIKYQLVALHLKDENEKIVRASLPYNFSRRVESLLDVFFLFLPTLIIIYILIPTIGFLYSSNLNNEKIATSFSIDIIGNQWYWGYAYNIEMYNKSFFSLIDDNFIFHKIQYESIMLPYDETYSKTLNRYYTPLGFLPNFLRKISETDEEKIELYRVLDFFNIIKSSNGHYVIPYLIYMEDSNSDLLPSIWISQFRVLSNLSILTENSIAPTDPNYYKKLKFMAEEDPLRSIRNRFRLTPLFNSLGYFGGGDPAYNRYETVFDLQNTLRLLSVDKSLYIPVNVFIDCYLTSEDVLHSWAVPQFGIKVDAIPGRITNFILYSNCEGVYHGQCSELCGALHGFMPICVDVITQESFFLFISVLTDWFKGFDIVYLDLWKKEKLFFSLLNDLNKVN